MHVNTRGKSQGNSSAVVGLDSISGIMTTASAHTLTARLAAYLIDQHNYEWAVLHFHNFWLLYNFRGTSTHVKLGNDIDTLLTYLSQNLQKYTVLCLCIPSVMSTLARKQLLSSSQSSMKAVMSLSYSSESTSSTSSLYIQLLQVPIPLLPSLTITITLLDKHLWTVNGGGIN